LTDSNGNVAAGFKRVEAACLLLAQVVWWTGRASIIKLTETGSRVTSSSTFSIRTYIEDGDVIIISK